MGEALFADVIGLTKITDGEQTLIFGKSQCANMQMSKCGNVQMWKCANKQIVNPKS